MPRLLLLIVIVAVALGWLILTQHGRFGGATDQVASAQAKAGPSSIKPEVAIQDGKTIDFSTGKPVVKDSPEDKAAIDAAVKEMDEASKDVTFGPTAAPGAEKKTADSAESPPKP
jgi:hypothetical protein